MSDFERPRFRPADELEDEPVDVHAPLHGEGSALGPIVPGPPPALAAAMAPPPDPDARSYLDPSFVDQFATSAWPDTPRPTPAPAPPPGSPYGLRDWRFGAGGADAPPPTASHDPNEHAHALEAQANSDEEQRRRAAHTDVNPVGQLVGNAVPPRGGSSVGATLFNMLRGVITNEPAPPPPREDPDRH